MSSSSKIKPYFCLESEQCIRNFTEAVRVENVNLTFHVKKAKSNGTEVQPTPVAYISNLDEFILSYLDKLDRQA